MQKKILTLLVLLMTAVTGAWADDTYTVQFKVGDDTKNVENVTLPYTFWCDWNNENGELDGIIKELYGIPAGFCNPNETPNASGNSNVTAGKDGNNQYITISAPFEGTATVTGVYVITGEGIINYELTISIPGYTETPAVTADPGYYLVGTMTGWGIDPQYKLAENPGNTAEQMIALCLEAGAEFKVVYTSNGSAKDTWYPAEAGNKVVDAAGLYTIYFRSDYQGGEGWHAGCIYVADGVSFTADGTAWTLAQMPACDVELEVEYYPLATLATTPAAAEGLNDATTADLLTPGTSNEGTLYYALGTSEAPTGQWSQTIPTTEGLEAGEYYVWYKVVGDAEHSDSQPQSIAVTVAALPAFAVTIDDAGVDASNWQATPAEQRAGQTVTLSYSGKKKIRSITIEKAETAPTTALAPALVDGATVVIKYTWDGEDTYFTFTNNGGTYSCNITGADMGGAFTGSLTKNNNTLVFTATNSMTEDLNLNIEFDAMSDSFYIAQKGSYYQSFTISVNGTDITSQLEQEK